MDSVSDDERDSDEDRDTWQPPHDVSDDERNSDEDRDTWQPPHDGSLVSQHSQQMSGVKIQDDTRDTWQPPTNIEYSAKITDRRYKTDNSSKETDRNLNNTSRERERRKTKTDRTKFFQRRKCMKMKRIEFEALTQSKSRTTTTQHSKNMRIHDDDGYLNLSNKFGDYLSLSVTSPEEYKGAQAPLKSNFQKVKKGDI